MESQINAQRGGVMVDRKRLLEDLHDYAYDAEEDACYDNVYGRSIDFIAELEAERDEALHRLDRVKQFAWEWKDDPCGVELLSKLEGGK